MKFEAITIKDIAKALGISTSTVSRALRDSYEISPETKQLVLECAEKLNYRPNPIALSLKERRSRSCPTSWTNSGRIVDTNPRFA